MNANKRRLRLFPSKVFQGAVHSCSFSSKLQCLVVPAIKCRVNTLFSALDGLFSKRAPRPVDGCVMD